MKIAAVILRTLLGLAFVVFGLNAFLNFMPVPPLTGAVADFFKAVAMETNFMKAVAAFQILGGLLTISGRLTPLGLTILGPILVNILIYHVTFGAPGLGMAAIFALVYLFLVYVYRANFAGLFAAPIPTQN